MSAKIVISPTAAEAGTAEPDGAGPLSGSGPPRAAARLTPLRIIATLAAVYLLAVIAIGLYWSRQPAHFSVTALQMKEVESHGGTPVPGTAVVAAAIGVLNALLDKPGGFLYNDVAIPGLYLDNIPSWEYGALKELRDSVRALRNDFSRSRTQSVESEQMKRADVRLAIDPGSWMLPSAEDEYRQALDGLRIFMRDLSLGGAANAVFYPRADNLAAYLAVVEKRLGSLAVRLSASVGDHELTSGLVPATTSDPSIQLPDEDLPSGAARMSTPWHQVDDIFYEARGYTWALLHMMQAIAIDFADVLAAKNAVVSVQQIIRELEGASRPMISPIVLNGHGYAFLANHSLVMASYLSRANAAVLDLRILMQQG